MVATAPTKSIASFHVARGASAPDLAYFRQRYPETVTNLGVLPRREEWLRRIWELETRWQTVWETRGGEALTQEAIVRSEEHTSELQSRSDLVCRLLLEKKKKKKTKKHKT